MVTDITDRKWRWIDQKAGPTSNSTGLQVASDGQEGAGKTKTDMETSHKERGLGWERKVFQETTY
jgi:hypothetical protein